MFAQKAEPLDESTFDRGLASSGPPIFMLDLRRATGAAREWLEAALPMRSIGAVYNEAAPKSYVSRIHPLRSFDSIFFIDQTTAARPVRIAMAKPAAGPVNLSLDEGLTGWALSKQSADAGFVIRAETDGCARGGGRRADANGRAEERRLWLVHAADRRHPLPWEADPFSREGQIVAERHREQRTDLAPRRPAGGMGFFDNMENRAPGSLPKWTDLEIVGDVASDAEAIAFGELMIGEGTAWFDEATLGLFLERLRAHVPVAVALSFLSLLVEVTSAGGSALVTHPRMTEFGQRHEHAFARSTRYQFTHLPRETKSAASRSHLI